MWRDSKRDACVKERGLCVDELQLQGPPSKISIRLANVRVEPGASIQLAGKLDSEVLKNSDEDDAVGFGLVVLPGARRRRDLALTDFQLGPSEGNGRERSFTLMATNTSGTPLSLEQGENLGFVRPGPDICPVARDVYNGVLDQATVYDPVSAMLDLPKPFRPRNTLFCEGSATERRIDVVKRSDIPRGDYEVAFLAVRVSTETGKINQMSWKNIDADHNSKSFRLVHEES